MVRKEKADPKIAMSQNGHRKNRKRSKESERKEDILFREGREEEREEGLQVKSN